MANDEPPFGPSSLIPIPPGFKLPPGAVEVETSPPSKKQQKSPRDRTRTSKGLDAELGLELDKIGKKKEGKSFLSALKRIRSIPDLKQPPPPSLEFPVHLSVPLAARPESSLTVSSSSSSAPTTPRKRPTYPWEDATAPPETLALAVPSMDPSALAKSIAARTSEMSPFAPLSQIIGRPSTASSGPSSRRSSASSISFRLPRTLTSQSLASACSSSSSQDASSRAWYKNAASRPFDQDRIPTVEEIEKAKACTVLDRDGDRFRFGDLIQRKGPTIVCFIRHFWCGLCAAYVTHLASYFDDQQHHATRARVNRANVKVLIIGNGSYQHISKYIELTGSPFHIYTDPTPHDDLFVALGMTLRTLDPGSSKAKGEYLSEVSMLQNIASATKNGFKMPFASPGDMKRLGGEFIFTPTNHPSRAAPAPRLPLQPRIVSNPLTTSVLTASDSDESEANETAPVKFPSTASMPTFATLLRHGRRVSLTPSMATSATPPKQTPIDEIEVGIVYAHRMKTTRDHGSVRELFSAAGVDLRLAKSCIDE